MSPGTRPTSVPNGIFIHPASWPQQTWAYNWGLCPLGGAGSPCNAMSPGPTSTSLSSGILIHLAVWSQHTRAENGGGGGVPLFRGQLGLRITHCGLGRGLPQYYDTLIRSAVWPQHVVQNWGCCVSPFVGERGFHLTHLTGSHLGLRSRLDLAPKQLEARLSYHLMTRLDLKFS